MSELEHVRKTAPRHCAPCGCEVRAAQIVRELSGVLWPTAWVHCRCPQHRATWTERYEWDFNVPLGNITWEAHEADEAAYRARVAQEEPC